MGELSFQKMHSLGNDFVVVGEAFSGTKDAVRMLADRRRGVGCDQVLQVLPSREKDVHAFLKIFNPDGTEVEACGNGTRCVMWSLAQKYGTPHIQVATKAGVLSGRAFGGREVEVVQGTPKLLSEDPLDLEDFTLSEGYAVDMGNPHLVVPVEDFNPEKMCRLGPRLEAHSFFSHKTNVEFVQIQGDTLKLWVWERGAGRTQACASGASAAVFVLLREGLLKGEAVLVTLEGGPLLVSWKEGMPVTHRAEVVPVFEGVLSPKATESFERRSGLRRAQ